MNNKNLSGFPLLLVMIALAAATFMLVLDYSIANVSIPYISGDMAVSVNQGTYVITSFAVGNAIGLPITGWAAKRVGSVRLLLIGVAGFVLFSWLCGASMNFPMLIICRFLQGLTCGPVIPLSQSLIVTANPPEKKNMALAFWSAVVIIAPIIGPVLGGWISYDYEWPWIFYINIPVGIFSLLVIGTLLGPFETEKEPIRGDWIGIILLAIGVTCLQIFLDKGEQFDWFRSDLMQILAITSLISLTLLVLWDLYHPTPLLELKLFKVRSFSLSVLFIGVSYAMYFGSVVLIPLWLQENMGYTPIWAGLAVAPVGIAPFILARFSSKVSTRLGPLIPLAFGFILFALSCFLTGYFDTDVDFRWIAFSRFLLGCAMVFYLTPLLILSLQDLPSSKMPSGTGIFHFTRAMVGGVGTSLFTTLWVRRSAYHHAIVGENLTPYSQNTTEFLSGLHSLGFDDQTSLALLNHSLDNQSSVLALNDCFLLMGAIFLVLTLFTLLGKRKKEPLTEPVG